MNSRLIKQITITTVIAMILESISITATIDAMMPLWIVLFYSYFLLNFDVKFEYFIALVLGIVIDITTSNILGQHALALIVASVVIMSGKRHIKISNTATIIAFIAIVSSVYVLVIFGTNIIIQGSFLEYLHLLSIVSTALCYPIVATFLQKVNGKYKY
jgi:rod shape-determining protein MreD